jgi:hypothetical protein
MFYLYFPSFSRVFKPDLSPHNAKQRFQGSSYDDVSVFWWFVHSLKVSMAEADGLNAELLEMKHHSAIPVMQSFLSDS